MKTLDLFFEYDRRSIAYKAALKKAHESKKASYEQEAHYLGDDLDLSGARLRESIRAKGGDVALFNNMLIGKAFKPKAFFPEQHDKIRSDIISYIKGL